MLARWPHWCRPLAAIAMAMLWPAVSLTQSINAHRRAKDPPGGLWLMCWRAALSHSIPPREFFVYQMHREGIPRFGWRFERETATLLAATTAPAVARLVGDKAVFSDWLADRGVPVVPRLEAPIMGDVVLKPTHGVRGAGITAWHGTGETFTSIAGFGSGSGETLSRDALAARARRKGMILQPLIGPHPDLGAACIARIVTRRPVGGAPAIAAALVQTPLLSDFCSHRGPFRLVDPRDGRILAPGPGQTSGIHKRKVAEVAFEGMLLPGWADTLAHLQRAHEDLPGHAALIGWDVIFGPDGPLVLEGNTGIGLLLFQADRLAPAGFPTMEDLA